MFLSGSLAACGRQTEQSAYHIEYLNKDKNRLVEEPYEPSATDTDGMIKEFLAKLSSDSDNVDYRKPIPNDVEITNYSLDGVLLTLHFDEDYSKMSAVDEVLCRAAVVRTMTQIDGVDCVAFYIGDAPLTDAKGNLVGTMNQDSFIENPGEQINSIQNTTLTLYFSNLDGDYWIGSTLERQWGTAKFTTYYLSGMLLTVLGASIVSLITGYSIPVYGANYVNFAMFMAFALLYPDAQVLLFFVFPIRMKWLAYIDVFYFFFDIVRYIAAGRWYYSIMPIVALLNFVIFFWPELTRFWGLERHHSKQATHFHNTVRAQQRQEQYQQQTQGFRHKCAVCGRTDVTNPELQFRYCSKCAGYHCFCSDHIFNHVHFTDEQP